MNRGTRSGAALAVALAAAWSCMDATDVELLEVSASGVLFGQAFLDLNGNGGIDAGDSPLVDVSVILSSPASQGVVRQVTTDSIGLFVMLDVPVGAYTIALGAAALGDSLTTLGPSGPVTVELGDTARLELGASYPVLSLDAVQTAVPGRRVFTTGIALNTRLSFGDGTVHFQDNATYLRATNVEPANLLVGDSVRLLGRTAVDNGRPILDAVTPFVLRAQAAFPLASEVTVGVADAADGGALDAALVRIRTAEIGDTSTVNGDLHFWAHDGADSVEVVFRVFLGISPTPAIRPDTTVRILEATGLLSPYVDASGPRWRLLPRGPGDVVTQTKTADVSVAASFDTPAASAADTVEITVTVRNLGPQTAIGVSVADTIPAGLTFLSATTTAGGYDQATGVWAVGDRGAGAPADTLRISAEVTGAPGTVTNTARVGSLVSEVQTNGNNDVSRADLTIS